MKIEERDIKMWSVIGSRATFGIAALEIAKKNKNLITITCDVSTSAGLDRYRKMLPDQYVDLGIAEQNMIGVAAGLASENFDVITTTFAPFQTMRCCEQIKVNIGYMKQNICMVGLASGLVLGPLGYTHCCIEDIGVLRNIPNLTIISPADSLETAKALFEAVNSKKATYIRLTGSSNNPMVYKKDYNFKIGKSVVLKKGEDVAIFATGSMVKVAIDVSKKLEEEKISASVINIHTIKPMDTSIIKKYLNSKLFVSIEEHNIVGGLGSAISEETSKIGNGPKHIFCGVNDTYSHHGDYKHLLENYDLTADKIIKKIKKNLKIRS